MTPLAAAIVLTVAVVLGFWFGHRRGRNAVRLDLEPRIAELESRLEASASTSRAAAAAADRQARTLGAVLEATEDGILVIDGSERIVGYNDAAATWFGLRDGPRATLMSAIGSAELRDVVRDTVAGDAPPAVPTDIRVDERLLRVTVVPTDDERAVLAIRDATELHRLARARRDLVANVSHDLRTPLTSLVLLVEMLLEHASADRRTDLAARIREQVDTLRALADALVEINSLESGRVLLRLEPMPLADLVGAAVATLQPQSDRAEVTFDVDVAEDAIVLVDRRQMTRVLANLFDNALRFSPPGGHITVDARPTADHDRLEVRVSDEGPGITVTAAQRVFERFYRADPARTGVGRGLGLAIARHVIEGHGGRIWIDAQARRGATICFTLPRAE